MKKSNEVEKESSNLLDCYRIALDFGMPAALRAYEKLTHKPEPDSNTVDSNLNSEKEELSTI